ncbi:uncharacterized protein TRIREDRAFT_112163 [Trichoderma reesei QM6a]|jgi:hypothetical protein|uniref:Predicted protein n=2 Tax=Hypocrea jecorina TaxID=51453 RepID=G0RWD3_HYPJQ|nr:uncharacterized protein TRIREDRAFT_112163 [Trichoderma reesei QM6a]EGR44534.1 predicted protein [Trichoderma reesei QM6a]ETR97406.1 hypothetical protein M419DRAFT_39454 [Trichoderma reesei RUT C-30]
MAFTFTKTYFLCPTSNFIRPPPAGPLSLGSIIRSTSTPQYPLNRGSIVAVSDADPPVVENDWKKTVSTQKGIGLGVYAQFLQVAIGGAPLGNEVNFEHTSKTANTFAFDKVTTYAFEPTQEYVQEAIQAPAVQAWLREPRQRFAPVCSLYLVTGLKLVKGARIKYSTSHSDGFTGNIGIDASSLGTNMGPKGHWSSSSDDETETIRADEFVFAFRVKRLRFGRKLKLKDYNKGAFMAIGGESDDGLSVIVEDVDGSEIETAEAVPDLTEQGRVYCVPA